MSSQLRTRFSLDDIIHSNKSLWTPKVVFNFQPVIETKPCDTGVQWADVRQCELLSGDVREKWWSRVIEWLHTLSQLWSSAEFWNNFDQRHQHCSSVGQWPECWAVSFRRSANSVCWAVLVSITGPLDHCSDHAHHDISRIFVAFNSSAIIVGC